MNVLIMRKRENDVNTHTHPRAVEEQFHAFVFNEELTVPSHAVCEFPHGLPSQVHNVNVTVTHVILQLLLDQHEHALKNVHLRKNEGKMVRTAKMDMYKLVLHSVIKVK